MPTLLFLRDAHWSGFYKKSFNALDYWLDSKILTLFPIPSLRNSNGDGDTTT
jgi:hypothetical protein